MEIEPLELLIEHVARLDLLQRHLRSISASNSTSNTAFRASISIFFSMMCRSSSLSAVNHPSPRPTQLISLVAVERRLQRLQLLVARQNLHRLLRRERHVRVPVRRQVFERRRQQTRVKSGQSFRGILRGNRGNGGTQDDSYMTYESQSLPAPGSVPTRETASWKRLGVKGRKKKDSRASAIM